MKLTAQVIKWNDNLYSVSMDIRGGSLETGNHKSAALAKRAFKSICARVGINNQLYNFRNPCESE